MAIVVLGCLTSTAGADDKLFRIDYGGPPSYLFAGRHRAWIEGVDHVPAELRRAIERSRVLIFAEPKFDKSEMLGRTAVRDRTIFTSGAGTIDQLSRSALEAYVRLTSVEDRARLSHARPGAVFMLAQGFFNAYVRSLAFDEDGDLDDETATFVRDMSVQLFGRGLNAREVREHSAEVVRRAQAGAISYDHALYRIARDRGIEVDALLRFETVPNMHDQYDRFVGVRDLDRGLVHFGEMLAIADDLHLRGSRVVGLMSGLIDADYLNIRNGPILKIEALRSGFGTPGLESMSAHARNRVQGWRDHLLERVERGGAFVSVPLEDVVGDAAHGILGLKSMLEAEGLNVVPVELGCGSFLQ